MTVNMKMDLARPRSRGLALGFNEAAGYLSLAAAAFLTGVIAQQYGLRPEPFYLGIGFAGLGLGLSVLLVRDTRAFVAVEAAGIVGATGLPPSLRTSFAETTWRRPDLFGVPASLRTSTMGWPGGFSRFSSRAKVSTCGG